MPVLEAIKPKEPTLSKQGTGKALQPKMRLNEGIKTDVELVEQSPTHPRYDSISSGGIDRFLARLTSEAPAKGSLAANKARVDAFAGDLAKKEAQKGSVAANKARVDHFAKEKDSHGIQTKIPMSSPGDKHEQEADAVAHKVVSRAHDGVMTGHDAVSATPVIQKKATVATAAQEAVHKEVARAQDVHKKETVATATHEAAHKEVARAQEVQKKDAPAMEGGHVPPSVAKMLKAGTGAGQPILARARMWLEKRMGADFSKVKIHTDSKAEAMNKDLGSHAFAYGADVYFDKGQYNPETKQGRWLLAHELTHVIQQGHAPLKKVAKSTAASQPTVQKDDDDGGSGGILGWIKDKISGVVHNIPGYGLLTVVIGKDPITGEVVPRTPEKWFEGFLGLVPGGAAFLANLKQSGALEKAGQWLSGEIDKLNITWALIKDLFSKSWGEMHVYLGLDYNLGVLKKYFGPPIGRLIDFAVAVAEKVPEFIFTGVLGPAGQMVMDMLKKAGQAISLIYKDPIKFLGNLVEAAKQGFMNFGSNIGEHLKNGLIEWLLGAFGGKLVLPKSLTDVPGIFKMITTLLGLTWDWLRGKMVKLLGEKTVGILENVAETSFTVYKALKEGGISGLWNLVKEHLSDLASMAISALIDWLSKTVVGKAVIKIVSMFNPVGAIIGAITSIYNSIMFVIEEGKKLVALVNSISDSIINIANGSLGAAATFIENTLASAVPLMFSFLARLAGVDKIVDKITAVIEMARAKIDGAVDKVIQKIKDAFAKFLANNKGLDPEKKKKVEAGILDLKTEEKKHEKDGKLSQDEAEKVAALIKGRNSVFTSVKVKKAEDKLKFTYTASPEEDTKVSANATASKIPFKEGTSIRYSAGNWIAKVDKVDEKKENVNIAFEDKKRGVKPYSFQEFCDIVGKGSILQYTAKMSRDYCLGDNPRRGDAFGERLKQLSLTKFRGIDGGYRADPEGIKWRGRYIPVSACDLGHYPVDAVDYWIKKGRKYGPKSPEVRAWMLDEKNYRFEESGDNQKRGRESDSRYVDAMPYKDDKAQS